MGWISRADAAAVAWRVVSPVRSGVCQEINVMIPELMKCVPLYDSRHVFPTLETSQRSGPGTPARCTCPVWCVGRNVGLEWCVAEGSRFANALSRSAGCRRCAVTEARGRHTLSQHLCSIKWRRVRRDSKQVADFLLQFDSDRSQGLTPSSHVLGTVGLVCIMSCA